MCVRACARAPHSGAQLRYKIMRTENVMAAGRYILNAENHFVGLRVYEEETVS